MARSADVLPDTNAILRYLLRDNAGQFALAEEFFEQVRIGRERALILEGVLVECIYVLVKHYQVSRGDTAAALIGLLQYKGVSNQDKDILIDALNRFAATKLDPVDCILLARSEGGNLRVFSFDKALCKSLATKNTPWQPKG